MSRFCTDKAQGRPQGGVAKKEQSSGLRAVYQSSAWMLQFPRTWTAREENRPKNTGVQSLALSVQHFPNRLNLRAGDLELQGISVSSSHFFMRKQRPRKVKWVPQALLGCVSLNSCSGAVSFLQGPDCVDISGINEIVERGHSLDS